MFMGWLLGLIVDRRIEGVNEERFGKRIWMVLYEGELLMSIVCVLIGVVYVEREWMGWDRVRVGGG